MPRGEFDRSERRARTRSLLLRAAARVYAERGIDRATLDDVAEEAGFTKGAVYDHFGSKENLLVALLDEHLAAEIGEQLTLFDAHAESTAGARRARIGAESWLRHTIAEPEAFRLFIEAWVMGQRDPAMHGRIRVGIEAWRAMFRGFGERRAAELGEAKSEALLDGTADLMVALGVGFALVKLADPERVPTSLIGAAYLIMIGALEEDPRAQALIEAAMVDERSESNV